MPFEVSTITNKGLELLAEATTSDRFIVDGCDATRLSISLDDAKIVVDRPIRSSVISNTTSITELGSTQNLLSCRAYFVAGTNDGGDAYSLFLYGHLQSQPDSIYVLYVVSNSTSFHLPEEGDITNEWEIVFNITYNTDTEAAVAPTQATYATSVEFNQFREEISNTVNEALSRVVTTHAESSTTTGENQTVYGVKTFKNELRVSSISPSNFSSLIESGLYISSLENTETKTTGVQSNLVSLNSNEDNGDLLEVSSDGLSFYNYTDSYKLITSRFETELSQDTLEGKGIEFKSYYTSDYYSKLRFYSANDYNELSLETSSNYIKVIDDTGDYYSNTGIELFSSGYDEDSYLKINSRNMLFYIDYDDNDYTGVRSDFGFVCYHANDPDDSSIYYDTNVWGIYPYFIGRGMKHRSEIGSKKEPWDRICASSFIITPSADASLANTVTLEHIGSGTSTDNKASLVTLGFTGTSSDDKFIVDADIESKNLYPSRDLVGNVGQAGKRWLHIASSGLDVSGTVKSDRISSSYVWTTLWDNTNSLQVSQLLGLYTSNGENFVVCVGYPDGSVVSNRYYMDNKDISRLSVSYIPDPVSDIYQGNLVKVPIGGLVLACPSLYWVKNNGSGRSISPGGSITVNKEVDNQWFALRWEPQTGYTKNDLSMNNYSYLEPGTYRPLSFIKTNGNDTNISTNNPILLQRIS